MLFKKPFIKLKSNVYLSLLLALWTIIIPVFFNGCARSKETGRFKEGNSSTPPVVFARFTEEPVLIDGILNDSAWRNAETYKLALAYNAQGNALEGGETMFSWDDDYFYVGVKFYDSDIVAEGEEDQLLHYKMGDCLEFFIKPEGYTWYWELYGTPKGHKTAYFYPGRGRSWLESVAEYKMELKAAADCKGTLNDWEDKDEFWTCELAVPISYLTSRGEKFGPGSAWKVLTARYNYSRYLPFYEISMFPRISRANPHLYEEYAVLEFVN
jgi:hypothetical protein